MNLKKAHICRRDGREPDRSVLSITQSRTLNLFFTITVLGTFLGLLGMVLYYACAFAALSNGSHAFDWLLGIFSDFVAIMSASLSRSPYLEVGASYPPLAIALLYPFARICRGVLTPYVGTSISVDALTSRVIGHPQFWIAYVLFFAICTSLILVAVRQRYPLPPLASLKRSVVIFLSTPFVYAVMRGNVIYFALIFLLIFLLWHDHENPVLRELSYLSLALAGMIKLYPLFFGVYLLHKKRWLPSFRVGIYFVTGTLLSFFLYHAGLDNLSHFLAQLGGFMNEGDRLLSGVNLSLSSLLFKIFSLFPSSTAIDEAYPYLNLILLLIVFFIATVLAVFTRSDFSRSLIASSVVVLLPSISYFYVLIFTLIPFLEFLIICDSFSLRQRRFYSLCFLLLFFTPMILTKNFIFHSLTVILMLITESSRVVRNELLPALSKKKRA